MTCTAWPGGSNMSPRNAERIALITGSNRGIGREVARQLARRGLHAVIASRDEEKGRHAAEGAAAQLASRPTSGHRNARLIIGSTCGSSSAARGSPRGPVRLSLELLPLHVVAEEHVLVA